MTHMGSSSGSEYRASESILNRANTTGRVGCRTEPLLNVFGNEVWIFLCKKIEKGVIRVLRHAELYQQAGCHSTITLVSVQIPTKSLPTLARPN